MNKSLLEKLKKWQAVRARRDNVEAYRVLPYSTLEEIARREPQTPEELLEVKGIKEKKLARYGKEILAIVAGKSDNQDDNQSSTFPFFESDSQNSSRSDLKVFEVSEYLDYLNSKLSERGVKIIGEVSSIKFWRKSISFDLKDKDDESTLKCFMWQDRYEINGLEIKDGMEVMILGGSYIKKQWGQLNFEVEMIELVGEGALKKAYDELKKKLELEGIFLPERKKEIKPFVKNIGLISSIHSDAIFDFRANLGKHGFQVYVFDSLVEGKQAVFSLIDGVRFFNKRFSDLDVLVMIRGGGSLESLQAFNTESLVREIASSRIPVLAGIGHEQDVTLAALVADKMVSTPTGAAVELTRSWDEAAHRVNEAERSLLTFLSEVFERFEKAKHALHREAEKIGQAIIYGKEKINSFSKNISTSFSRATSDIRERIKNFEDKLKIHDPERQLKLGYSLVSAGGKIVRSVKQVKAGDKVTTKISDGEFDSEIKEIKV